MGGTPFGWAFFNQSHAAMDYLATCDIDIFDAIRAERLDRVQALLDDEPDLLKISIDDLRGESEAVRENPVDYGWRTPLAQAVFLKKPDAVKLLLERGADPDLADPEGRTIRQLAQTESTDEISQLLT